MYYHIRRINPLGINVYYKDDNKWTEDYDQRKIFPTLFQVEQIVNAEVTDKYGVKRKLNTIKNCIVEDSNAPPHVALENWTTDDQFEKWLDSIS